MVAAFILGNNIDVDPTFKCHAERSRSICLKRGLRSFTLVQDDKFAKKMSRGSTAILLLYFNRYFTQSYKKERVPLSARANIFQ